MELWETMSEQQPRHRAELRLRELAPRGVDGTKERLVGRLEALANADALDSYSIDTWGADAVLEGTDDPLSRRLREPYDELEDWAEEHGRSLESGFLRREQGSIVDEESREVVSFPLFSLVVYDDAGIEAVYPHRNGDQVYTIRDGLERLSEESGRGSDG